MSVSSVMLREVKHGATGVKAAVISVTSQLFFLSGFEGVVRVRSNSHSCLLRLPPKVREVRLFMAVYQCVCVCVCV